MTLLVSVWTCLQLDWISKLSPFLLCSTRLPLLVVFAGAVSASYARNIGDKQPDHSRAMQRDAVTNDEGQHGDKEGEDGYRMATFLVVC